MSTDDSDLSNAACSIKFINELLEAEKWHNNKIAILDFRLDKHTNPGWKAEIQSNRSGRSR